jgi:16S rRNA processing protein RimM
MKQDLTPIGRLGKAHGLRGEIKLSVHDAYAELVLEQEVLFVAIGGQHLPYFIEILRGGGSWLVKFEEVEDKETAAVLQGATVSLPTSLIQQAAAAETVAVVPYLSWLGYTLKDAQHGELGQIEEVLDLPQHYLARLRYQGREVYIPLHEDLILRVDDENQCVDMDLPDGLLSL